ncbi:tRNA (adenine(58)-N(1))-methyltransferase catalytic subunit TRMT61A-like [Tetranychus urticae]|uniref:tRNA (adenine(58)-N(1))-methyltransferase catalytic subunit TRMT61A n=1 Tax=Tetranychus urticae TaxID=32264 RepID=T1KTM8_TETUR|nr:tRNA (adenine(58)-N(1))-methyltransferase catalytic subunit TRMT61A-like [Tetranychus urticae]
MEKGNTVNVNSKKAVISAGDHLFIFISPKQMYPLKVVPKETFQTKFGPIKHNDLIGVKYGTKLNLSKGWVYVLPFTPELWTLNLPHRTQILYSTDISMITCQLNLKPGSVVIESGTGSGSLSHAIIRTIAPDGFLHTFDFHLARANEARKEFDDHGLTSLVRVENRDVCQDGFGLKAIADALFLDLPHPWTAIPFAYEAMKPFGSRICCFSPCIEQVQKTVQALQSMCFMDIGTMELVSRPFETKQMKMEKFCFTETPESESNTTNDVKAVPSIQIAGHTGFLTFATKI